MKSEIKIELGTLMNSCFVVMPFSSLFQVEYEKIIQPVLHNLNITCIRGDEIYSKQRIVDDIWNSIKSCRFVIAELTGKNPNVLYEIGLAHALGKPVIIITRNGDDVPFDLKSLRYLFYDVNDPFWGENLQEGLKSLILKVINNPGIENYLEGIISEKIEFPEISKEAPKPKQKIIIDFDLTGTWKGEFEDGEGDIHYTTLSIVQEENVLKGNAIMEFKHQGEDSIVNQLMDGEIDKYLKITLRGVNYTYLRQGKIGGYALDTYQLTFDSNKGILSGVVISNPKTRVKTENSVSFHRINDR